MSIYIDIPQKHVHISSHMQDRYDTSPLAYVCIQRACVETITYNSHKGLAHTKTKCARGSMHTLYTARLVALPMRVAVVTGHVALRARRDANMVETNTANVG